MSALWTSDEIVRATGGTLHQCPAHFGWPPEVSAAHFDLMGHELGAQNLFVTYDPTTRLQRISRPAWLGEMAVLASRADVDASFRTNVIKRLRRVSTSDAALWADVMASCAGRADPAALIA